jgi:acetyl-CoA carboxylase carboxyltransferase component
MRPVLELLVDGGEFLEVQPRYGTTLVTALAWLGGRSVAIVANDPAVRAGALDAAAAIKAADFIETAAAFGLPLVFLADNPGVLAGRKAEREGILKWGGKMFLAQRRARVPKLHVTLRKSFGFGSTTMAQNPFDDQTLTLAFPGVTLSSMPAESGGRSARLDAQEQVRVESAQRSGPWSLAAGMVYDEVIDPRELRNALRAGLELCESRRARR